VVSADPEATDDALVAAFQAGDVAAFEELVRRYRRQIHRVCRGILRSPEQADEACQDAFVKAWNGLARFQGQSSFKTWMYRIGMNAAHDMRAREATQARVRDESAREAPIQQARSGRAADPVEHAQELRMLREAVANLPDRQRETLLLKVQQDLKYTEISDVLGCPVGTAKANFHHAVQNLRRALVEAGLVPRTAGSALPLDTAAEES
jgi:RNA polymerase sigma-70 factor, ECF subfamily